MRCRAETEQAPRHFRGPRRDAGFGHVHLGETLGVAQRLEAFLQEQSQFRAPVRAVVEAHGQLVALGVEYVDLGDVEKAIAKISLMSLCRNLFAQASGAIFGSGYERSWRACRR